MYSGVELAHAWIVLTFGTFNICRPGMQKSSPAGAKDQPGFLSYQAETASSKEGGTLGERDVYLVGRKSRLN